LRYTALWPFFVNIDTGQHEHLADAKRCVQTQKAPRMGGEMTLQPGTEQQLAGGWLAYCARAHDVEREEHSERVANDDDKKNLTEGRSLANRD
jgi:hypothetical protein